jgi:hypothetical protein
MVNLVPVDRQRHAGKGWRQQGGYGFAAEQALVPLTGAEFARAAVAMPIAFIEHSGRYIPVAVLSPVQGRNLFVAPTGQWLGSYIPAALRSYPFRLRVEGNTATVLIDEDSGWVVEAKGNAARYFEDDGTPSAALKSMTEFLQKVEENLALTAVAVAALAEARLIRPWPMAATIGNEQVTATDLYRIDEAALDALDEHTFMRLRKTSSLALAYAQLISAHTVGSFQTLAKVQKQMAAHTKPLPEASSLFPVEDGGSIKFN